MDKTATTPRISRLGLFITRRCNFNCVYCNASTGDDLAEKLTIEELRSLVCQARALGAKRLVISGEGEPLLDKNTFAVFEHALKLNMECALTTNGSLVDKKTAEWLFQKKIRVYVKLDSLNPQVQNMLIGSQNKITRISYKIKQKDYYIPAGIANLLAAGYGLKKHAKKIMLQTVITSKNINDIPQVVRFAKEAGVLIYVERLLFDQGADFDQSLIPERTAEKELFKKIRPLLDRQSALIFRTRCGYETDPIIDTCGNIRFCFCVKKSAGNIRNSPLSRLVEQNRFLKDRLARISPKVRSGHQDFRLCRSRRMLENHSSPGSGEKKVMNSIRQKLGSAGWLIRILGSRGYLDLLIKTGFRLLKSRFSNNKTDDPDIKYQVRRLIHTRSASYISDCAGRFLRIVLSYGCNAHCQECYTGRDREEDLPAMDIERVKAVIAWAKNNRYKGIRFIGGEPTIQKNFIPAVQLAYKAGMIVGVSTNNLYQQDVLNAVIGRRLGNVTVNFSASYDYSPAQESVFQDNLAYLKKLNVPFGLAYILRADQNDCRQLTAAVKRYKPSYVRTTLRLPKPGQPGATVLDEQAEKKDLIFAELMSIQKVCLENRVLFYNYRTMPECFFSQEQWRQIRRYSPLVSLARCEIGYRQEFANNLTVNPDLSILPCPSIFIKGPELTDFKDKKQINRFYQKQLGKIIRQPARDQCRACGHNNDFKNSFAGAKANDCLKYFQPDICQGGCLTYRLAQNRQYADLIKI